MKLIAAFAISLLLATVGFARAASEPSVAGFWEVRDSDGNPTAWFLFAEKNGAYYARLVKGFKKPGDEAPPHVTCTVCPGKLKGAHIMGLTLFWGMKRDGLHYTDGSVLDPRDGTIYHALMNLSEDGKELEVRGYVGISLLGQSQTWYRLPNDAMTKEDIPKEILANGEEATGDKSDKPKAHISAEKTKAHKSKADRAKADKSQPADTESADPAKKSDSE